MAYIMKPSPMNELAKLLGQAAGLSANIGVERSQTKQLGNIYQREDPGLSQKESRALASKPGAAAGYFKVKAAREKAMTEQERAQREKEQALDMIKGALSINAIRKDESQIPLGKKIKGLFQTDVQAQKMKGILDALKKNPAIKKLGFPIPEATHDPTVVEASLELMLGDLQGQKQEAKVEKTTPEEAPEEPAQEKMTRRERDKERRLEKRELARNEGDLQQDEEEQDVAREAALQLQQGPVDNAQQDEAMDPAALQMQQEMGQEQPPGEPEQGGGFQGPVQPQQPIRQLSPGAIPQQPIGARYAPGEERPQGTSFEGIGAETANVLRSGAAGVAGVPRQVADLAGAIQGLGEKIPVVGDALSYLPKIQNLADKIPARQEIFAALGGKRAAAGTMEKAIQDLAGDIPEQLAWTAMLGALKGVPAAKAAVQHMWKNIIGAQTSGNMWRFISENVVGEGQFSDGLKNAVSLMYTWGQGPLLEEVATETYKGMIDEVPDNLRPKNLTNLERVGTQLHKIIQKGSSGFYGDDADIFKPFVVLKDGVKVSLKPATYKQAFEGLTQIEKGNPSNELRSAAATFRQFLKKDFLANNDAPKEAQELLKHSDEMWKQYKMAQTANDTIVGAPQVVKLMKENKLKGLLKVGLFALYSPLRGLATGVGSVADSPFELARVINTYFTNTSMQKYYNKVIKSAVEMDGSDIADGLILMNKVIERGKLEKKKPEPKYQSKFNL